MKISHLILGRSLLVLVSAGVCAGAAVLTAGCGQRGPLFLAPQSVPYTLLPAANANGSTGVSSISAAAVPAGVPAAPASAANK